MYNNKKFTEAEIEYRKALQKNNQSFEANYNLGNSLFRQEKYKEAFEQYKSAVPMTENKKRLATGFHNIGNSFMAGGQLQDAIEAYKMALRNNPADNDTRYNLAYAQSLLKNQQNQDNQDNKDNKNNDQNQKQNEPEEQPENNQQEQQQQQPQMSKENAQQILNALEQDERDTQEKAKKTQTRGSRRVDKDW